MPQRLGKWLVIVCVSLGWGPRVWAVDEPLPDSDVLMRALTDELARSMKLQMEDLEKPYFVQYGAEDTLGCQLTATYGAITGSERNRSRNFSVRMRVGSMELDNTNFAESGVPRGARGGGARGALPIDDDYLALRQAIWRAADADYKNCVETLTRKRAYMRDKNIVERPNDFVPAAPVEQKEPTAVLHFDAAAWEANLRKISGQFKRYEQVQDANVRLLVSAGNSYLVNSEGTRLRSPDAVALLLITAQVQAEDGMRLSDGCRYTGKTPDDFPPLEKILADVDALVADLAAVAKAPVIEHYSGPVLFDDLSAAQVFQTLLSSGVAARPDPVGEQRRGAAGAESLESKLGTRILPKVFQVWDDPTGEKYGGRVLLGHYRFDDEGVPAARVEIATDGKLADLCRSRTPTKKLSGSNGHGRAATGGSAPDAAVGCLFIKDNDGVPEAELKAALVAAAKDAGLEYGVRVKSLRTLGLTSTQSDLMSFAMRRQRSGGATALGDPIVAYKVFVADGHEEPFRGAEFGPIDVTALKKIAAAGDTPHVYNYIGVGVGGTTPPTSIIAPPVLFEELELSAIQQEHDKPPLLAAPAFR